jgi:hypothetical protein
MKRISFRLSRKLAEKFDLEAEKRGVTKASLLREWIDEFKFPDRINFDSGLERDFNLRLEDDDVLKLVDFSVGMNINVSTIIRIILLTKLENTLTEDERTVENLWRRGMLGEISDRYYQRADLLDDKSKITLAKALVEIGDFDKARNISDLLDSYANNLWSKAIEAEIYLRELNHLELENNINFILQSRSFDSELKSHSYYLQGRLEFERDNFEEAHRYYKIADYLTASRINKAKIAMWKAIIHTSSRQNELARKELGYANKIVKAENNQYYIGRYYYESSINNYCMNNLLAAENNALMSVEYFNKVGAIKDLYYSYDSLFRIGMRKFDVQSSIK